jgi:hypothetical protein
MTRKTVDKMPETNVCGSCDFCRVDKSEKDSYMCWAEPPKLLGDLEEYSVIRGMPVNLIDPKCHLYRPRHNA